MGDLRVSDSVTHRSERLRGSHVGMLRVAIVSDSRSGFVEVTVPLLYGGVAPVGVEVPPALRRWAESVQVGDPVFVFRRRGRWVVDAAATAAAFVLVPQITEVRIALARAPLDVVVERVLQSAEGRPEHAILTSSAGRRALRRALAELVGAVPLPWYLES